MGGEFDLASIKAHREAVAPLFMGDPSSVMYQIVIDDMGALISELERLQAKYDGDRPRYRYKVRM